MDWWRIRKLQKKHRMNTAGSHGRGKTCGTDFLCKLIYHFEVLSTLYTSSTSNYNTCISEIWTLRNLGGKLYIYWLTNGIICKNINLILGSNPLKFLTKDANNTDINKIAITSHIGLTTGDMGSYLNCLTFIQDWKINLIYWGNIRFQISWFRSNRKWCSSNAQHTWAGSHVTNSG